MKCSTAVPLPGKIRGAIAGGRELHQAAGGGLIAVQLIHAATVRHPFQGPVVAPEIHHLLGRWCQFLPPLISLPVHPEAISLRPDAQGIEGTVQPGRLRELHP